MSTSLKNTALEEQDIPTAHYISDNKDLLLVEYLTTLLSHVEKS